MRIEIKKLNDDVIIPNYAHVRDAGADFYANWTEEWWNDLNKEFKYIEDGVEQKNYIKIPSNKQLLVPSGFALNIPVGYEVQVRMKSGLALNHSVILTNSIGTIDSGYHGEVKAIIRNLDSKDFIIKRNSKIGQLVINEILQAEFTVVDDFKTQTSRGEGGFGSTGV